MSSCRLANGQETVFEFDNGQGFAYSGTIGLSSNVSVTMDARYRGTFDWSSRERGGRCRLDNRVTGRIVPTDPSALRVSGALCGHSVDREIHLGD